MTNLSRGIWLAVVIGGLCPLTAAAQQSTTPPQGETVSPARGGQRGLRVTQAERANMPSPQGFSVVLVLGEMQGTGAPETVPPAARKALADMKDFLPYKTYRLLDTQWTLCCGRSAIVTRLRGDEQDYYDLELEPNRTDTSGKWSVRFTLRNALAGIGAAAVQPGAENTRMTQLTAKRAELERQLRDLKQRYNDNHPEVQKVRAELAEVQREQAQVDSTRRRAGIGPPEFRRTVIDTSFNMDIGETVVVGTSRLRGDKALIALLTAVASTKPSSTR